MRKLIYIIGSFVIFFSTLAGASEKCINKSEYRAQFFQTVGEIEALSFPLSTLEDRKGDLRKIVRKLRFIGFTKDQAAELKKRLIDNTYTKNNGTLGIISIYESELDPL